MKLMRQISLVLLLGFASSCAFFNEKVTDLSINSNPPGADIFIEGRHYGKTPATINIEPKKYVVTLTKEGYGSTNFTTEVWGTIRTDVNGETTGDGTRCLLDSISVVFFFNVFTTKCADFKQKQYFVTIPRLGASGVGGNSMMGLGHNPSDMIGYYYNQDSMSNPYGNRQQPQNRGAAKPQQRSSNGVNGSYAENNGYNPNSYSDDMMQQQDARHMYPR